MGQCTRLVQMKPVREEKQLSIAEINMDAEAGIPLRYKAVDELNEEPLHHRGFDAFVRASSGGRTRGNHALAVPGWIWHVQECPAQPWHPSRELTNTRSPDGGTHPSWRRLEVLLEWIAARGRLHLRPAVVASSATNGFNLNKARLKLTIPIRGIKTLALSTTSWRK